LERANGKVCADSRRSRDRDGTAMIGGMMAAASSSRPRDRWPPFMHSVMGDEAALDARARQMEDLAREERYPSGSYLPALSRGFTAFEREDFSAAIAALAPLAGENERIGGSRAQHDLIEFTLLKAYLEADRAEEAQRLLSARRPGASGVPVAGLASAQ